MAAVVQPVFSIVSKRSDELGTSLQIWFASAGSDLFSETAEFLDSQASGMARPPRLERGTLCLEGRCSIQLSYGRTKLNCKKIRL